MLRFPSHRDIPRFPAESPTLLKSPSDGGEIRTFYSSNGDYSLRVHLLEPGLVRIRYAVGRLFEQWPGYAVALNYQPRPVVCQERYFDDYVELSTGQLLLRIDRKHLKLSFYSEPDGELLQQDEWGFGYETNAWTGGFKNWVRKLIRPNEYFFGLGDKPCDLNLRGRRQEMWGSDYYAFHEHSDPLYKNIPFFLGLSDGKGYGIFYDNTARSYFDFGATEATILQFGADRGTMDYYFIYEPTPIQIISTYTRLTGPPELPPLWSLGYHQSRWSYYPAESILELAETFRAKKVPCDAIHLDIHHMDRYISFTWDSQLFPDPEHLVGQLGQKGFKTVSIVNPGVKVDFDSPVWQSGYESDCFCRRHDGFLLEGNVWPGVCHFPDFTMPRVRDWWSTLCKRDIGEVGIRGLWNDMNEPAVFPNQTFPEDTRHFYDGRPCSHVKAHNIYGQCMMFASWQGMLRYAPERRPFMLSRSGYAGLQKFSATWTGDNCSTWEHLKMADFQCQRLASSGVSFAGSDAGGFLEHPSPELFCRWMQLAAFHIFFRNHSSGEYGGQEPWSFGDQILYYVRKAIERRYQLLPYFYTLFQQYATEGTPMIRSLPIQCFEDTDTYWRGVEFFLGDHMYIVPILEDQSGGCSFYVPPGHWFSYEDSLSLDYFRTDAWFPCDLSSIPVFVRGGAVIPHWPIQQYVGELQRPDCFLDLWWAPDTICESQLYEDEGEGMSYLDGNYTLSRFQFRSEASTMQLSCTREGQGTGFHNRLVLRLHALPHRVRQFICRVDGQPVPYSIEHKTVLITLPDTFREIAISWLNEQERLSF